MIKVWKSNDNFINFFFSDHIFKALEFADKTSDVEYNENTIIHNPQIIRDIVKITGYRFKLVPRPDQEIEEEEVCLWHWFCFGNPAGIGQVLLVDQDWPQDESNLWQLLLCGGRVLN